MNLLTILTTRANHSTLNAGANHAYYRVECRGLDGWTAVPGTDAETSDEAFDTLCDLPSDYARDDLRVVRVTVLDGKVTYVRKVSAE